MRTRFSAPLSSASRPGLAWAVASRVTVATCRSRTFSTCDTICSTACNLTTHAIITTPRYLQQLAEEYDSLTRLIYSGDEPSAIADFHIKLLQARIRTVLGRVDDATLSLQDLAVHLKTASSEASADIAEQDIQTQQVATAITEMAATAHEIARNIQETDNQIAQAKVHCQHTDQQLKDTQHRVTELATQAKLEALPGYTVVPGDEGTESRNRFVAPTTPGPVSIYVVLRDERNGTTWRAFQIEVP